MTDRQLKHLYFPTWHRCAHANDWVMVKGRLLARDPRPEIGCQRESDLLLAAVWAMAEARARQAVRGMTADDLRHGCHIVALQRDKSSKDFTNAELDRVVTLFKVLTEPTDLDALMAWQNPEIGERKRLVWAIKSSAPFAYIDKICRDKFGSQYTSPFYEDLSTGQLRHLAMTLRARRAAKRQPVATNSNEPF